VDGGVNGRTADALLAAVVLLGLVAVGLVADGGTALLDPAAAAVGVAGALVLELPFLLAPERAHAVWTRSGVRAGAALVTLVGGAAAALLVGPTVVGALVWGLVTYFLLLGAVVGQEAVGGRRG
jgi:hypothetical protein